MEVLVFPLAFVGVARKRLRERFTNKRDGLSNTATFCLDDFPGLQVSSFVGEAARIGFRATPTKA